LPALTRTEWVGADSEVTNMEDKIKCDKCDERGYITEHITHRHSSSRSCECGWAIQQQAKRFEGWSLSDLVNYKNARLLQKGKISVEELNNFYGEN